MFTKRTKSTALPNQAVGLWGSGLSLRAAGEELYEQIERVWNAIPISLLHALYDSMPKRVRAVRKEHCKAIK